MRTRSFALLLLACTSCICGVRVVVGAEQAKPAQPASAVSDPRHIRNGWNIPSEGYADQPYLVKTDDGAWLCAMTITFVVDGVLCDGGDQRQFGWGRFSPTLRAPNGSLTLKIAPSVRSLRLYRRALRTSEAVGNFHAGQATKGPSAMPAGAQFDGAHYGVRKWCARRSRLSQVPAQGDVPHAFLDK